MAEYKAETHFGLFQDRILNALISGHFIVDLLNSMRSLILAFLSIMLGMTNSGLGILTSVYVICGALAQPFFGYFSDRIGARWVATGGILGMGCFFTLAMFFPGWPAVGFLILSSICSGAFHPAGASEATLAGSERMNGREATASSLFFLFGQTGVGIGPILGGVIIGWLGMPGLGFLSILTIPVAYFTYKELRTINRHQKTTQISADQKADTNPKFKIVFNRTMILLIAIAAFQSWVQTNVSSYMPRYYADLNMSPAINGVIISLFTIGSAIGCFIGGELADRTSSRAVIAFGLLSSFVPLALIPMVGVSPLIFVIMFLAGFLSGAPYSVIVVQAQKIIPGGMGLASGIILGFIFSAGAIGMIFTGMLADKAGYAVSFYSTAVIALAGGVLALLLPMSENFAD
jgi:FSR family fosmidomycin resistance protein-like MFS transporter